MHIKSPVLLRQIRRNNVREGWLDSIYFNFRKAFSGVPHGRLVWKIKIQKRYPGAFAAMDE